VQVQVPRKYYQQAWCFHKFKTYKLIINIIILKGLISKGINF